MQKTILLAAAILLLFSEPGTPGLNSARQPAKAKAPVVTIEHCRLKFVQERTLASGQAGVLKFVSTKEGSVVKANTVVAGLQDTVVQAQYTIAEKEAKNDVDIEYARKAAAVAQSELKKSEAANDEVEGTVPAIEIERLRLAWERAELQIKLAKHKQQVSELTRDLRGAEVKTLQVKAPFRGVVTEIFKRQGEAVANGEPILTIVNPTLIRAEARVPFAQAIALAEGDRVEFELDLPKVKIPASSRTISGKVAFVDVKVDKVSRKVKVWADLTNNGRFLGVGLTGTMRIYPSAKQAK